MTRASSNVLIDQLWQDRSLAREVLGVVGFSLLTAVLAQIRVPLPFTPVPLTGQTFAVLLSGAVLGWRRGFLSQALYLAEGIGGLPVFVGGTASMAHLLGPTGGYLWSFPLAAALLGWLVERGASRSCWRLALSLLLADALILIAGASWLRLGFAVPYSQAWLLGFYPFLIGDILKVVLVGLALPRALKRFGQAA